MRGWTAHRLKLYRDAIRAVELRKTARPPLALCARVGLLPQQLEAHLHCSVRRMMHRTMPRMVHCIMPQPRDAHLGQRRRKLHSLAQ